MFRKYVVRGLLFLVPILITFFVIGFAYNMVEHYLGGITDEIGRLILPQSWQDAVFHDGHVPGLSLVLFVGLLAALGFVASWPLGRSGLRVIDFLFLSIPGVRSLYAAIRKIIDIVGEQSRFQKVVMITWANQKTIGFATGETVDRVSGEKYICVFVPHMPNPTSGFILLVPATEVVDTGLTPEEGIKMGISLGVLMPPQLHITPGDSKSGK